MQVELQSDLAADIARLRTCIGDAAAATELSLTGHVYAPEDDDPRSPLAEHKELSRQLAALRDRVAEAPSQYDDPRALRAELATLLFFANTLQADADVWRAALEERLRKFERQRIAERLERERLAAERRELVRRRDALELTIVRTAESMAHRNHGECRRTLPVFTLGAGLTVCSVSVSWPRRGFRFAKHWLVTLNHTRDDVLVRRQ
jgi:hypothetical protein